MRTVIDLHFTWGIVPAGETVEPVPRDNWESWAVQSVRMYEKRGDCKRVVVIRGRQVLVGCGAVE